jgi:hypothetical protein
MHCQESFLRILLCQSLEKLYKFGSLSVQCDLPSGLADHQQQSRHGGRPCVHDQSLWYAQCLPTRADLKDVFSEILAAASC